ncbi:MAG: glycosyltransferase [Verrucomicrobiota bacterium]
MNRHQDTARPENAAESNAGARPGPGAQGGGRILVADLLDGRKGNSEVTHFFSAPNADFFALGSPRHSPVESLNFPEVRRRIAAGLYQAAFIGRPVRFWNPRKATGRNLIHFGRSLFSGGGPFTLSSLLGLLKAGGVPVAGVDFSDRPIVDNSRFPILEAAEFYFKRELPLNPANAFLYTSDKAEDTGNIARIPFFIRNMHKQLPAHLGIRDAHFEKLGKYSGPRDTDIIFAGSVRNRPLRETGMKVLHRLKAEGFRVIATDQKFSKDEYYALVARSRLCWSPEGFGFDCYRTYEAAALGCAPVLKTPPIHQSHPYLHGESALYYRHESVDLYDVLKTALTGGRPLEEMGRAARIHTERHHCSSRVVDYMMRELTGPRSHRDSKAESPDSVPETDFPA